MTQYLKYIETLVLSLLISSNVLFAQSEEQDTVTVAESIPQSFFSVDLGVDYLKLASYLTDTQKKYEGEAGITIWKIRLTGEYGMAELTPKDAYLNADYFASGTYWRTGMDFKIDINPKNDLLIGIRYAQTKYDESVTIAYDSQLFDPFYEELNGLNADWYEAVISSESKLIAGLYLGFKFRLRFINKFDNPGSFPIYSIPGYGISYNKSQPAVNFYLKYRIGF